MTKESPAMQSYRLQCTAIARNEGIAHAAAYSSIADLKGYYILEKCLLTCWKKSTGRIKQVYNYTKVEEKWLNKSFGYINFYATRCNSVSIVHYCLFLPTLLLSKAGCLRSYKDVARHFKLISSKLNTHSPSDN